MKEFFIDLSKRVIKTICETALGIFGGCYLISEVNWTFVFSACGLSALATVLLNLPNMPLGENKNDSK